LTSHTKRRKEKNRGGKVQGGEKVMNWTFVTSFVTVAPTLKAQSNVYRVTFTLDKTKK
jgi:hypothetical protein